MTDREGRESARGSETRPIVYCLIPPDLGPKLHDLLRNHFRDDPSVEVVVEQRHRDRRSGEERRQREGKTPPGADRRRVRSATGRRIGERRAPLVPLGEPPPLPRRARRYAEQITFVERLEPATADAEDLDTARLVTRFQAGEREVFTTLYSRYFDRVYGYLRLLLKDRHEAEDATQQVFTDVFATLPRYERRDRPFKAWLFTVVRHQAIRLLRKSGRVSVVEPGEIDERREAASEDEAGSPLTWLTDRDLIVLVERLPEPQRQVLALRYLLNFSMREIAEILGMSPNRVSVLHYRALGFLRERLAALDPEVPAAGRPEAGELADERLPGPSRVLRDRAEDGGERDVAHLLG